MNAISAPAGDLKRFCKELIACYRARLDVAHHISEGLVQASLLESTCMAFACCQIISRPWKRDPLVLIPITNSSTSLLQMMDEVHAEPCAKALSGLSYRHVSRGALLERPH